MQAILMGFSICLLGVVVTMVLFTIAIRPGEEESEGQGLPKNQVAPERFFNDEFLAPQPLPDVSLEISLHRLEEHVRREQQAARVFLDGPSTESLHAPSESPLWH